MVKLWPLLVVSALAFLAPGVPALEVTVTSSHIGSFPALVRALGPADAVTLVNWDAHDDAFALDESRRIRPTLWTSAGPQEDRLLEMDQGEFLEGYTWIEPLMPRPVARLVWVRPGLPSTAEANRVTRDLNREVRKAGLPDLEWTASDEALWVPPEGPWVLSVDLDVLAGDLSAAAGRLARFLSRTRDHPPRLVTACVSAPYLAPGEPGPLVRLFLKAVLEQTPWTVRVDPQVSWGGRDRGQEARLKAGGRTWAEYDAPTDGLESWIIAEGQGRVSWGTSTSPSPG